MIRRSLSIVMAALVITGCAVGPNYKTPVMKTPVTYAQAEGQKTTASTATLADWWKNFGDATLTSLVERTISNNLDVRIAQARLREARATLRYTEASYRLPSGSLNSTYTRSKTSTDNPQIPKLEGGTSLIPSTYGAYQTYLDASYELDLFGGIRREVESSTAQAQSQEESLRGTLVSAVGEVARDYLQLRQYQDQFAVARRTEESRRDTLKITQVRYKAGLATDMDVANASANLASTQAVIPTLESNISQVIHAISVLVGENPAELTDQLEELGSIPSTPSELPVGLPSDLLCRRPDIRQAERSLAAATADIGVQVSNLFPKITMTAQYGGQSGTALNLVNAAARFFTLGPQINWGLLNYSATKANVRASEAKRDQQYLAYQKSVLTAFQDVENALVSFKKNKERTAALEEQVAQYRKAADTAMTRYTKGLTTFLDVLDTQRALYNAEDSLVQSKSAVNIDLISLYKALGGGWERNDPVANAPGGPTRDNAE